MANLSRFSKPACWGQLTETHTTALACPALFTCFANHGAGISKIFFFFPQYCQDNRVLFLCLRSLAEPQTKNVIHPLKGLKDTENLQYFLCTWLLHGSRDGNEVAGYLSGCLCANDFADDSTCPFYFYSMQKLIIEAIN